MQYRIIRPAAIFWVISISLIQLLWADENDNTAKLDKIVVTPSRSASLIGDIPTDVSVIDSKTIESQAPVNTDDLLRYIPGVDVSRRSGATSSTTDVTLRGFNPTARGRTLVLVDGIPFNQIYSGEVYWNAINPKDVESIEVVPGVSSIYGPGAMGGVINIITKKPQKLENDVDLSYGSFETRSFHVEQANKYGNFGYVISGGGYKTNGYIAAPDRHDYDIRRWKEDYDANVKMTYDFDDTSSVGIDYRYYDETVNGGYKYYYGTKDLNNLSVDFKKEFSNILELSAAAYYEHENYWWTQDNTAHTAVSYVNTNPKSGWGGHAQALIKYPEINKFWLGMDWDWGKIDSRDDYKAVVQGDETGGRQTKIGLYLQDEVTIWDKLMLYAGGRVDFWENYGGFLFDTTLNPIRRNFDSADGVEFSPKGGAVYHITDDVSIRASVGKGFRVPTLYDLYKTYRSGTSTYNSNPNLSPEKTYTYEAGIDTTFMEKLLNRVTFYFNDVSNLIYSTTTQTAAPYTYNKSNVARVHIYGIETETRYALNKNFSIFGNYTLNLSRIAEHTNPALENKYLVYTPRNKVSFGTSLHIPKFVDVDFLGRYNGIMFGNDANTTKTKDIYVFDLAISKEITKNFKVSVKIENLFDSRYQEYLGTLAPPRWVTVDGKFTF